MKKTINYILLQLVIIGYSLTTVISKYASKEEFLSPKFIFYYGLEILILLIYAFLWQQILKKYPLIVAYAYKATSIIWSLLLGYLFFKEKISFWNVIGSIVVIVGIIIMLKGEHNNE